MNHEVRPRVSNRALYSAALELTDPAERQAYLNEACANDPQQRAQIEQLLAAHAAAQTNPVDQFTEQLGLVGTIPSVWPTNGPSTTIHPLTIDRYKIREQLGEGGMGVVYVAEQTSPVRRKVALKVIKPGLNSRDVVARFEAERQALAMMDHPNIAKVLDGATLDDGRPYFVMELVNGIPITEFCDTTKLSNRDRLELYIDVCSAVQHAHLKGVIHRDLKPNNVLVTISDGKPMVKVIDFGISKALAQPLTEHSIYTAVGEMVGTPLYMSPEQAQFSAHDVDTRSDVYSLGVMLYELLTGSTPFDKQSFQKSGFDEMRRLIREVDPPRPSQRVSTLKAEASSTVSASRSVEPRVLTRLLAGELDWIVMKSLEKDRNRRYQSARELADDIQRYLDGAAVQACPASVLYKLNKFARHNKGWLTSAALLLVALSIGMGVASWQAVRASAAEQLAVGERRTAQRNLGAAMSAIEQLLAHVGNPELAEIPGLQDTREKILRDTLTFYDRFTRESGSSSDLDYRAAKAFFSLGELAIETDRLDKADQAFSVALSLADALVTDHPQRLDYRFLQGSVNEARGRLCTMSDFSQAKDEAIPYLKQAEQQYAHLVVADPDNAAYAASQASALEALASTYAGLSPQDPRIVQYASRACDLAGPAGRAASSFRLLGMFYEQSNPELAGNYYHRALANTRIRLNTGRDSRFTHAWICHCVASFLATRRPAEAESLWKESIALSQELAKQYPNLNHQFLCCNAVYEYFIFLAEQGRGADADAFLDQLLTEAPFLHWMRSHRLLPKTESQRLLEALTDSIAKYPERSDYYRARGTYLSKQGETDAALADLNRAVELHEDTRLSVTAYRERGDLYARLGQHAKAIDDYTAYIQFRPSAHLPKARAWSYFRLGRYDECLKDLQFATLGDLTTLTWIPLSEILACPDQTFRDQYLELIDQTVESKNRSAALLILRASVNYELEKWDAVHADLGEVLAEDKMDADVLYQAGLLSLAIGDVAGYHMICDRILYRVAETDNALANHFFAWTCTLRPDAVDDFAPAIRLAQKAVAKGSADQQYLVGLGAALLRAGEYEQAMAELAKALLVELSGKTSTAYIRYFQSIIQHHLGNDDEAEKLLRIANETADKELAAGQEWNRELTLQLLRKEAESLLAPSPAAATGKTKIPD